jgi:hypothetical protein
MEVRRLLEPEALLDNPQDRTRWGHHTHVWPSVDRDRRNRWDLASRWAVELEHSPWCLQSQARWRVAASSSVSSSSKHRGNAKDCSGDDLSIRGRGCRHHGCSGPKNANASGSRRRMTPVSRSDRGLRFVLSRQRFVRRSEMRDHRSPLAAFSSLALRQVSAAFSSRLRHFSRLFFFRGFPSGSALRHRHWRCFRLTFTIAHFPQFLST